MVGTSAASRGTYSPRGSTATSGSVTAAARILAFGSSAKTEAGSPTSPRTTSFRAGGAVAHADSSATRKSSASDGRLTPRDGPRLAEQSRAFVRDRADLVLA